MSLIHVNKMAKQFKVLNRCEGLGGACRDLFSGDYRTIKAVDNLTYPPWAKSKGFSKVVFRLYSARGKFSKSFNQFINVKTNYENHLHDPRLPASDRLRFQIDAAFHFAGGVSLFILWTSVQPRQMDMNKALLTAFNKDGYAMWLQVESGNTDMDKGTLLD